MPDPHPIDPLSRIEAAIARIERETTARAASAEAMTRRHAALRARMAEAVAALDDVLGQAD